MIRYHYLHYSSVLGHILMFQMRRSDWGMCPFLLTAGKRVVHVDNTDIHQNHLLDCLV